MLKPVVPDGRCVGDYTHPGFFVAFASAPFGLPTTPPHRPQQAPGVVRVVTRAEPFFDQLGDTRARPQVGRIAAGGGPAHENFQCRPRVLGYRDGQRALIAFALPAEKRIYRFVTTGTPPKNGGEFWCTPGSKSFLVALWGIERPNCGVPPSRDGPLVGTPATVPLAAPKAKNAAQHYPRTLGRY